MSAPAPTFSSSSAAARSWGVCPVSPRGTARPKSEVADRRSFILQHTRLQSPPLVPELRLHLADEITPLWQFTEKELDRRDAPPPFWAFAWVGGQALARYLLDGTEDLAGRHVLDVGSGSGLCAIAAAKAGAMIAEAADVDPFSREATSVNADTNRVRVECIAADLFGRAPPRMDVVLAGDVCYERDLAARALAWLERAHLGGARVLIGDPGRPYFPRHRLIQLAEYRVPASLELEDGEVKPAGVYTFPYGPANPSQTRPTDS